MSQSTELVLKLSKKLEKIIAGNKPEDVAVDILKTLKETPVTLEVLQKTRIGMTVNDLRKKSQNKELQAEAKAVIKIWKKLLDDKTKNGEVKEKMKNSFPRTDSIASNMSDGNSVDSVDCQMDAQNSNSSQGMTQLKNSLSKSKQPTSSPSSSSNNNRDDFRTKSTDLILKSLTSADSPDGSLDATELAVRIEQSIFNQFGSTNEKYRSSIRSRVFNLRDKKNVALRESVLLGLVTPDKLAVMKPEDMASDEMREQRKKYTKQAIDDHQLSTESGTPSEMFKCGKCGKKNCTYTQVQTRSADEPMTTFVFCRECGNRWKLRLIRLRQEMNQWEVSHFYTQLNVEAKYVA